VATVGDDPEGRVRNRAIHFYAHFDGVKKVSVTIDDQGWGSDFGEERRGEIHVVVAVFHAARPLPDGDNLLVAVLVAFAHGFPLAGRLILDGELAHDNAGLLRKIHCCANHDHGLDAIRLHGGHVEKNVAAHADADGSTFFYGEMVEESKHVQCALAMCDGLLRVGGVAMAAGIWQDERIFAQELIAASVNPIFVAASAAVEEQERFSGSLRFVIDVDAVQLDRISSWFHRHWTFLGRARSKLAFYLNNIGDPTTPHAVDLSRMRTYP
jgi:hypothetical protein